MRPDTDVALLSDAWSRSLVPFCSRLLATSRRETPSLMRLALPICGAQLAQVEQNLRIAPGNFRIGWNALVNFYQSPLGF